VTTEELDDAALARRASFDATLRGEGRQLISTRSGGRPMRVESLDTTRLSVIGRRPPLRTYLAQLWQRRHFIHADARGRVLTRNSGMLLGTTWLVLRPAMEAGAYLLLFGVLLETRRDIPNFIGYLIVGVFLFRFTIRSLTGGAGSMNAAKGLLRSFTFPRAAVPIAHVIRETYAFLPVLAAMVIILLAAPEPEVVSWRWALLPAVLALQFLMNLGFTLLAARIAAVFPDVTQVIAVGTRFWLYGSAVFFTIERFDYRPNLQRAMEFNPMFQVLDIARDCLLYGVTPRPFSWLILSAWAFGLFIVGFLIFWRAEESYGKP
jgi:teichoic acid transport system permease protein